jgi:hypothetical protein
MWLFLFQFVGIALVLGAAGGYGLHIWDTRKVDIEGEVEAAINAARTE